MSQSTEGQTIKLFVSIRREDSSDVEFKKLILIVDSSQSSSGLITISMLKRQIEKEFSDLFPFEEALVCSKLEDNYGYALSNISKVCELLGNGDRVLAIPASRKHDGRNVCSHQRTPFLAPPRPRKTSRWSFR